MQWVSILLATLQLLSWLTTYLHEKRIISDAQAATVATVFTKQSDVISKALKAREAARARNSAAPPGSLPDDGFRRD